GRPNQVEQGLPRANVAWRIVCRWDRITRHAFTIRCRTYLGLLALLSNRLPVCLISVRICLPILLGQFIEEHSVPCTTPGSSASQSSILCGDRDSGKVPALLIVQPHELTIALNSSRLRGRNHFLNVITCSYSAPM